MEQVVATATESSSAKPTSTGKAKGEGEEPVGTDVERNSLAAEAQQSEPPADAAQLSAAGATMVTAADVRLAPATKVGNQQEIGEMAAPTQVVAAKFQQNGALTAPPAELLPEQAKGEAAVAAGAVQTGQSPVAPEAEREGVVSEDRGADRGRNAAATTGTGAGEAKRSTAGQTAAQDMAAQVAVTTTGSDAEQKSAAAAPVGAQNRSAERFVPTPMGGASSQAAPATPATATVQEMPAGRDQAASVGAAEKQQITMPWQGGSAEPAAQDRAAQSPTTVATEEAPAELTASGAKVRGPEATSTVEQQPPVQVRNQASDAGRPIELGGVSTADRKDPRTVQGAQQAQPAEMAAAEQAGVISKGAAEEPSGTKLAQGAATGKPFTVQGGAGQYGSGDAGTEGHPEQKAQGGNGDQIQQPGIAGQAPAATEVAQPETKPVQQKSALHENILSQIRERVVTHDGKGNGQMSIRLNPGELGELTIQVRMEDNKLRVEVQAENRMVKDLLMSNLDSLKEALTSKNFTMEGFDVSTGGSFNGQLREEKGSSQQKSPVRNARVGGYGGREEGRVNYLTGEANNLLDVRF